MADEPEVLTAKTLRKALAHVSGLAHRRSSAPILSAVRIHADPGGLRLCATDLDRLASVHVDCQDMGQLDVAIPAFLMTTFLTGIEGPIGFHEVSPCLWRVTCGDIQRVFSTFKPADFPPMEMSTKDKDGAPRPVVTICLPAASLSAAIRSVSPAISADEARYYLNGAYLHMAGGKLRVVATDGRRLMLQDVESAAVIGNLTGAIVPRGTVVWLAKHLMSGDATIKISGNYISAEAGSLRIVSKLIDGTFPDYARIVPSEGFVLTIEPTPGLAASVSWLGKQSGRGGPPIKITCNGSTRMSVKDMDGGSTELPLLCERTGEDMEFALNPVFLSAELARGANPTLHLSSANAPIRIDYADDPGRVGVLMPCRA